MIRLNGYRVSQRTIETTVRFGLLLSLLITMSAAASAQNTARPDRGIRTPNSYAVSDLESVSLTSGNVNLSIPLAGLPPVAGGRLSWAVRAVYNSKVWDQVSTENVPQDPVNQPPYVTHQLQLSNVYAWQIGQPYRIEFIDSHQDYDWLPPNDIHDPGYSLLVNNQWVKTVLTTPDGATHELRPRDFSPYTGTRDFLVGYYKDTPDTTAAKQRYFSYDGSYLWAVIYQSTNATSWELYLPDGTKIQQLKNGTQKIYDTNSTANSISIFTTVAGATSTTHYVDDTTGREVQYVYNASGMGSGQIIHKTVGGTSVTIDLNFGLTYITGRAYLTGDPNCGDAAALADTNMVVLRSIVFPQSDPSGPRQQFTFSYNSDTTQPNSYQYRPACGAPLQNITTSSRGWGALSQVVLPTGAAVNYTYTLDGPQSAPLDAIQPPRESLLAKALQHDGVFPADQWSYSIGFNSGSVTGPDASVSTETYYPHDPALQFIYGGTTGLGGLVYRSERSAADTPGKIVTERHWTLKGFIPGATYATGTRQAVPFNPQVNREYTTLVESGVNQKMSATKTSYDFNGNVSTVTPYDWFDPTLVSRDAQGVPTEVPASAAALRTTTNTYYNPADSDTSANICANRLKGSATPLILNALQQTVTGSSQTQLSYDNMAYGVAPANGNVTTEKRWDSANVKWLSTTHTYDGHGNLISTTDPKFDTTTWAYDFAKPTLPTSITVNPNNGTGTQVTGFIYDDATNLVLSQTDPNGRQTTINYTNQLLGEQDPYGRPGIVTSPADAQGRQRQVKTFYHDIARQLETWSDLNQAGDGLLKSQTTADQLGRPTLSQTSENGSNYTGGIQSELKYSQLGKITASSNPSRAGAASTDGWTRTTRDGLGRVTEVETFSGSTPPGRSAQTRRRRER